MNSITRTALIALSSSLLLAGCGSDDDDDYNPDPMPEPENQAPMAETANFTTEADTVLTDMLSATDADGDELSFMVMDEPSNGQVMIEADGSFMYTPAATFTGTDSFSFTVSDGEDTSGAAEVSITVDAMQVSFSTYSRSVFNQQAMDEPLPVNGREFEQDVTEANAYDDLIQDAD
ncbi:Ig-like domain-containing protein [Gilvimarinus japonicus]|jgi:hypothetical protein|uniref:Ig-like domain-containing protein n=1 Tax=Gilvimarinus japonicus TaxID=1796469 RepID=A0ABV7HVX8_9GAMM